MKTTKLPYNMQFFADPEGEPTPNPEAKEPEKKEPDKKEPEKKEPELTPEEELAKLRIENSKLRRANDAATHEAADYKRKYTAKLTEAEAAAQEKAEAEAKKEEEFQSMKKELAISKVAKALVSSGFAEDQAAKAAEAQYEGDFETYLKIQNEVMEAKIKAKEAEWLKSRPEINTGVGGKGDEEDPFLKGFLHQ
jgi:hypothetical protein